jgi:hypothetical protein
MKKTFVETIEFSQWVNAYLPDVLLAELQRELLNDPDAGAVIPGCGGLRKIRVADPRRGKGKRGGVRVVYLNLEEFHQIHFITIYAKDQKDDLSTDEKKLYRQFVEILKDKVRWSRKG